VPIVIGPNYSRFAEVIALVNLGGCIAVTNQKKLNETFDSLIQNGEERYEKGHICATFVQTNRGATGIILKNI
jgi:3-deoxy-D-manno-octulosonic-acid transferase